MTANGLRTVAVILVAGGAGERLGADVPKAFVHVAGRTLLEHAAARFVTHPRVRDIVVVVPAAFTTEAQRHVSVATVAVGGASRQESVAHGLAHVAPDIDVVLVHDVARAFVPAEVIDRVLSALETADGAVLVVPVTDTIRACDPQSGELGDLIDRTRLRAMQTPQGFRRSTLVEAHELGRGLQVTDDVALVEALGRPVVAVLGDERALKITVPLDLAFAEVLAEQTDVADLP
jgi:2-C-methyl-D-erythritol 4-phosphate cytidylyltransferase